MDILSDIISSTTLIVVSPHEENVAEKRSNCPIAFVVDIIGDRWTLLIVRDINNGKCSFGELAASDEQIAPSTLTNRLERLTGSGLISKKRVVGGPGRQYRYELTARGKGLMPVISEMVAWKAKHFRASTGTS